MASEKNKFIPDWYEGKTPQQSFRSLFKWHDPNQFKHPNQGFTKLLRDTFHLTDKDFSDPNLCLDLVADNIPSKLSGDVKKSLVKIVGAENVSTDTYSRLRVSYGAGMIDIVRLREKKIENICDAVINPKNRQDIEAIVHLCNTKKIPITVYGGGSTVTRGMEAVHGGISLDMSVHMNKVLAFNEIDQTITVQPGIYGPALEEKLNNAPEHFASKHRYTCGNFPQSFEHSSVGGWVVTRGAGQNSTYYGKIEDLVLAQEYVTPIGRITTKSYPRQATGPDIDQIMIGSEGCFGILTAVTLRVFKFQPQNTRRFSFLFRSWEDATGAYREIMQGEFGYPSVFRLSDPEETDTALRIYHIHATPADTILKILGFKPMWRCLLLGTADGDQSATRLIKRKIRRICRKHKALNLSSFQVTKQWEHSRFTDPYMREDLLDFGILIDTLECAVSWHQLIDVHASVRAFVKSHPNVICMTHISHAYPQGANLYFIFIIQYKNINQYLKLQYGILEKISQSGAAMSHHHGIGKQTAPWLESQIGTSSMQVIRALKNLFDPNNIMNPGGTLGLDMSREQKDKIWGMQNFTEEDHA